jgi:hypothetical protein
MQADFPYVWGSRLHLRQAPRTAQSTRRFGGAPRAGRASGFRWQSRAAHCRGLLQARGLGGLGPGGRAGRAGMAGGHGGSGGFIGRSKLNLGLHRAAARGCLKPLSRMGSLTGLRACLTGLRACLTGLRACLTGQRACLTGLRACLTGLRACLTGLRACLMGLRACLTGRLCCLTPFLAAGSPPIETHAPGGPCMPSHWGGARTPCLRRDARE